MALSGVGNSSRPAADFPTPERAMGPGSAAGIAKCGHPRQYLLLFQAPWLFRAWEILLALPLIFGIPLVFRRATRGEIPGVFRKSAAGREEFPTPERAMGPGSEAGIAWDDRIWQYLLLIQAPWLFRAWENQRQGEKNFPRPKEPWGLDQKQVLPNAVIPGTPETQNNNHTHRVCRASEGLN